MAIDFLKLKRQGRPAHTSMSGVSPAETIRKLKDFASLLSQVVQLLAKWTIDIPEIEVKILMADHMFRDVTSVQKMRERLDSLGAQVQGWPMSGDYMADVLRKASVLEGTAEKVFFMYRVLKSRVCQSMQAHLAATHLIWDEPTVRILTEIIADLQQQIAEAANTYDALCLLFPETYQSPLSEVMWDAAREPYPVMENMDLRLPELPARDSRFSKFIEGTVAPEPQTEEQRSIFLMNMNLMGVEITTIEACSRTIIEFPEMPWEFVMDMARQNWDEARHAMTFYIRFHELGGKLDQYPITHKLWRMSTGQPLAVRLGVHQRIGEWHGVDGALWHAEQFRKRGDLVTARIFDYVALDEITHVRFGNKWITYLVGTEEKVREVHEKAARRRCEFGDVADGPLPFPFNRWACELSMFSSEMIGSLEALYNQKGSRFS
jgi:uncharacterized ferritin-like protein (DUF455 family)